MNWRHKCRRNFRLVFLASHFFFFRGGGNVELNLLNSEPLMDFHSAESFAHFFEFPSFRMWCFCFFSFLSFFFCGEDCGAFFFWAFPRADGGASRSPLGLNSRQWSTSETNNSTKTRRQITWRGLNYRKENINGHWKQLLWTSSSLHRPAWDLDLGAGENGTRSCATARNCP